jgi:hypothetical protein
MVVRSAGGSGELPAIVFTQLPQPLDWRLRHPQEGERLVRVEAAYRFNNAAAVIPTLTAGLAVAAQPEIFVRRELASGALETVLPDWTVAAIPIHALTPPAKTRPARVRVLIEFLRQRLGDEDQIGAQRSEVEPIGAVSGTVKYAAPANPAHRSRIPLRCRQGLGVRHVRATAANRAPLVAPRPEPFGFGALMGGLFPISVIFSLGDIGGGLSASADDTAWMVTVYNVGQLVGQPLLMITAGAFGRGVGHAPGRRWLRDQQPGRRPGARTWARRSPRAPSRACSAGCCRPS